MQLETLRRLAIACAFLFASLISHLAVAQGSVDTALFSDNFNDGVIRSDWTVEGNTVFEADGALKIVTNQTDGGGYISSAPLLLPQGTLSLTRKVKLHYGNRYAMPSFSISYRDSANILNHIYTVFYGNMSYQSGYYLSVYGTFLGVGNSNPHISTSRSMTVAGPPVIWDAWFEEKITYNQATGEVRYSRNGLEEIVGFAPRLPAGTPVHIRMNAWGWYTGHSHFVEDLVLTGAASPLLDASGVLDEPKPFITPELPAVPDTRRRNVTVLVHGWNSNPSAWATDTKIAIERHLSARNVLCSSSPSADPCWEVKSFDWEKEANTTSPLTAFNAAFKVSDGLFTLYKDLYKEKLNHLHLIGHSAGSHVIHLAAKRFEVSKMIGGHAPTSLQLTFLDPYTPIGTFSDATFGAISNTVIPNFSDSYVTKSLAPPHVANWIVLNSLVVGHALLQTQTASDLNNAYSFEVSSLDRDDEEIAPLAWVIQNHAWPYQLYQCSIDTQADYFVNGSSPTLQRCPANHSVYNFGFPLSLEYSQFNTVKSLRQTYKPDTSCKPQSTTLICGDGFSAYVKKQIENGVTASVNFKDSVVSTTGTVLVSVRDRIYDLKQDLISLTNNVGEDALLPLISKFNLSTGSPVWLRLRLATEGTANSLHFKFKFTQNGRGYLRAFLHGREVWSADQRDNNQGQTREMKLAVEDLAPGVYEVAFRLDPLTDLQSGAELSGLEFMKSETVQIAALPGDIDNDGDVDLDDLNILLAARNKPASGSDDSRDLDKNMVINALDARKLTTLCTRPRCATK